MYQLLPLLPPVYALITDTISANRTLEPSFKDLLLKTLNHTQEVEKSGHGIAMTLFPLFISWMACGNPEPAIPAAAAWRAYHIAAKWLDDLEDGDYPPTAHTLTLPNEENPHTEFAQALNLSTGFIALSGLSLAHLPARISLDLQPRFNETMLVMAGGQHLDLSNNPELGLDGYFRLMKAKSGAFFALAARAGALCAGANEAAIAQFEQLGYTVGILVQLIDDIKDWSKVDQSLGDLSRGRFTLPAYYGLSVASPGEKARLQGWLAGAKLSSEAETQAHNLIEKLGMSLYIAAEIEYYRSQALRLAEYCSCSQAATGVFQTWLRTLAPDLLTTPAPARYKCTY